MASSPHHTATTAYPCCVPALGDSAGAGCVGLAAANIQAFRLCARKIKAELVNLAQYFTSLQNEKK